MSEHNPSDELSADDHLATGRAPHDAAGHTAAADWDPRDPHVLLDPLTAYDAMRAQCPVAQGPDGAWTLFAHRDVVATALDPATFSNAVSRHLQVPNGMDGPAHAAYRAVVDRYFTPARVRAVEPVVRQVADDLVATLAAPAHVDAVALGALFAVRAQSAWLGWPQDLEGELLAWVAENRDATRSRDSTRTAAVAEHFRRLVASLTAARRGDDAPDDVTTELVRDQVDGRPLTDAEVVSVLRNWTGGDLGSMALCAGVVLAHLADHPDLQARLRAGVDDDELDRTLDEVLRVDDPFVSNRRIATRDAEVGGRRIAAGDQVLLHWTAANRDPEVFGDAFDPGAHAADNLVWGIGPHVCPGRPLALLELRTLVRALLAATTAIEPDPERAREREQPPAGSWAAVPLVLR